MQRLMYWCSSGIHGDVDSGESVGLLAVYAVVNVLVYAVVWTVLNAVVNVLVLLWIIW